MTCTLLVTHWNGSSDKAFPSGHGLAHLVEFLPHVQGSVLTAAAFLSLPQSFPVPQLPQSAQTSFRGQITWGQLFLILSSCYFWCSLISVVSMINQSVDFESSALCQAASLWLSSLSEPCSGQKLGVFLIFSFFKESYWILYFSLNRIAYTLYHCFPIDFHPSIWSVVPVNFSCAFMCQPTATKQIHWIPQLML